MLVFVLLILLLVCDYFLNNRECKGITRCCECINSFICEPPKKNKKLADADFADFSPSDDLVDSESNTIDSESTTIDSESTTIDNSTNKTDVDE